MHIQCTCSFAKEEKQNHVNIDLSKSNSWTCAQQCIIQCPLSCALYVHLATNASSLWVCPLPLNTSIFNGFRAQITKPPHDDRHYHHSFPTHIASLIPYQRKWREWLWHQSLYHLHRKRHFARHIITCRPEWLCSRAISHCAQISSPSWHLLMSPLRLFSLGGGRFVSLRHKSCSPAHVSC